MKDEKFLTQKDIINFAARGDSRIKEIEDILTKLSDAHTLLAKSNLKQDVYNPISSLLATAKTDLFELYRKIKQP